MSNPDGPSIQAGEVLSSCLDVRGQTASSSKQLLPPAGPGRRHDRRHRQILNDDRLRSDFEQHSGVGRWCRMRSERGRRVERVHLWWQ